MLARRQPRTTELGKGRSGAGSVATPGHGVGLGLTRRQPVLVPTAENTPAVGVLTRRRPRTTESMSRSGVRAEPVAASPIADCSNHPCGWCFGPAATPDHEVG